MRSHRMMALPLKVKVEVDEAKRLQLEDGFRKFKEISSQ